MKVQDCIGCGFCCTKAKCAAGQRLYGGADMCPALLWDDKAQRHVCDLMQLPSGLGELYRKELYAGEGCCMNLNSWRREPLKDRTLKEADPFVNPIPPIMQKFLAALGREWISGDKITLMSWTFASMLQDDGMSEEEAKATANRCIYYIKNSRSSVVEEFMG